MNSFLKEVTRLIYNNKKNNLDEIAIVFPNKRARLFFNKYLSEIIEKPVFSPDIFTINEIFNKFCKLNNSDELTLNFKLYQIFKKYIKTNESFDDFYFWGQMLISDFNDIDNNLINPENIFALISEIKEIENIFDYLSDEQKQTIKSFWKNFNESKDSKQKQEFLIIWRNLYSIYKEFTQTLTNENIAYQGLINRLAIQNFNIDYYKQNLNYKKIYFVGFNALNKTEKKLFDFLKQEQISQFYWDFDDYYINNKYHEASFFMRENIKNYPPENKINTNNLTQKKDIKIISVPSNTGQVKLINNFLEEFKQNKNFDINNTAIVLPDESLLIPVLSSLPDFVDNVNITMGFPVSETPAFTLLNNLIELQLMHNNENLFYHKIVKKILEHPYIKLLHPEKVSEIINKITTHNQIYLKHNDLHSVEIFKYIFKYIDDNQTISKYLTNIIKEISNAIIDKKIKNKAIVEQHLQTIFLTIKKTNELIQLSDIKVNTKTYLNIIKTIISSKTIPFNGEPLKGLQIMGILETRTLDFENLIVLSLNEGIMPKTSSSSSFIPYNIRKAFGIPTIEYKDAIFGYYFYRLLQRAKNIRLVYNSAIDSTTKEKSRFLTQLLLEKFNDFEESDLSFDVNVNTNKEIIIEKNEKIQEHLKKYLNKEIKLSPSAINVYINCNLAFYFKYIAGIDEPQEVSEDIDPMQFGSIFHETMENLYKGFYVSQKNIEKEDIYEIQKNIGLIENELLKSFSKVVFNQENAVSKSSELKGKNNIIFNVIFEYIIQLLYIDMLQAPFKIIDLEGKYYFPLEFEINNKTQSVITGGSIDRVDFRNNFYHILDYKTGKADAVFSSVEQLFDSELRTRPKEVMQTFIYTLAFMHNKKIDNALPGVIQVLKLYNKDFSTSIKYGKQELEDFSLVKDDFLNELSKKVSEIFNPNIVFFQTTIENHCEYCAYKNICHR